MSEIKESIRARKERSERPVIKFNSRSKDKYSRLSNFDEAKFTIDGVEYRGVERYYQSMKFEDKNYAERIRDAATPQSAKNLGKSRKFPMIKGFEEKKINIMFKGVLAKFTQNADLKAILLETGDADLVESAPWGDRFWGVLKSGEGRNEMGKILRRVRGLLSEPIKPAADASSSSTPAAEAETSTVAVKEAVKAD